MNELLSRTPGNPTEFRKWCQDSITALEMLLGGVPTAELKAQAAAIVVRAKTHAYSVTAYDLADVLPARDEKNLVDALLRLRECLVWIDSGGPDQEPAPGVPLTVRQAARRLNVDDRTIYALCSSGALAHHRIGNGRGTIRITPENILCLLDRSRVDARSPQGISNDHLFGPE